MHALIENGAVTKYPYTIGNLRKDNPQTSFPKRPNDNLLAEWGVYEVNPVPAPSHDDRTQRIEQSAQPHQENGEWFIGWTTVDKTAEEIAEYDDNAAKSVRYQRDSFLAETDWVVIMHTEKGTNIPADMEIYRQDLRNITDHVNFPHLAEGDWPVKPE